MKAWKVTGIARFKFHHIPKIEKIEVQRFTKVRVYLNNNSWENIETNDVYFAHHWFQSELEAVNFVLKLTENRKAFLESTIGEMDTAIIKLHQKLIQLTN